MEQKPIAVIRLGKGQVAFYDELTKIYLNYNNKYAKVYPYHKTVNLKNAIRYNRIELIAGTLENPIEPIPNVVEEKRKKAEDIEKSNLTEEIKDKEKDVVTKTEEVIDIKIPEKETKKTESKKEDLDETVEVVETESKEKKSTSKKKKKEENEEE